MKKYIKTKTLADNNKHKINLNLKITDFGKQNTIQVSEIVSHINRLPEFHLQELNEILYDPDHYTPKIISHNNIDNSINSQGIFIQSHRLIVIFELHNLQQFLHVLFHELGHHVYFKVISQSLKMRWVKKISRNDKHISKYASRNAAEDFAETYASYLLEPDKLKNIPLKYNFIRKHIFKDVAFIMKPDRLDFRA